jgi:hypothetical protein
VETQGFYIKDEDILEDYREITELFTPLQRPSPFDLAIVFEW